MNKRSLSLKMKFILMYAGAVLVPILILSTLFIQNMFTHVEETLKSSANASFQQTRQLLEYYMNNVNDSINSLLGLDSFHKVVEKDNTYVDKKEQIDDMLSIRALLNTYRSKPEISDIHLYIDNEAIYIGENSQIQNLEDAQKEPWFEYVESSYPSSVLIPGSYLENKTFIGYAKAIRNSRNYNHTVGIVFFDINQSTLVSYLGGSETTQVSLINERGDLIADSAGEQETLSVEQLEALSDGKEHVIAVNHKSYLAYVVQLDKTDWYLSYLEPYDLLLQSTTRHGTGYLIAFLLLLIFGLLLFYLFFQSYLSRVTALTKHMKGIREKLPEPMNIEGKPDEINDLIEAYNYMLGRVTSLLKEQYELGNQIKEIEMKALYEQINPHFLYNTLTMINWLAEDGQTEDVSKVITSLSAFYRLSLNKGNENIYLKEELEIIQNFVYIQRMRFGTEISLEFNMDPMYYRFLIPKLTLQPLIENALVHGILKKKDKSGVISVSVHGSNGFLEITIRDTGIGMPEDVVQRLNDGTLQTEGKHYGVWNVVKRASMYYNAPCTLTYSSREGEGSEAVLTLPYQGKL